MIEFVLIFFIVSVISIYMYFNQTTDELLPTLAYSALEHYV